eukprot:4775077-Pyramimonas_sp.AAC.1
MFAKKILLSVLMVCSEVLGAVEIGEVEVPFATPFNRAAPAAVHDVGFPRDKAPWAAEDVEVVLVLVVRPCQVDCRSGARPRSSGPARSSEPRTEASSSLALDLDPCLGQRRLDLLFDCRLLH